jgi:hypothetical protein
MFVVLKTPNPLLQNFFHYDFDLLIVSCDSGVVKTRDFHITFLSCSKALVASGVHENSSFLVSVIKGASILP